MVLFANDRKESRLSPNSYTAILILLAICGLITSIYLTLSHYRNFTDIGYQSFCALSRSLNCDTVSQSPYAIFLGVPVAVWGLLGYLFFGAITIIFRRGENRSRGWAAVLIFAAVYSLSSIGLAVVSTLWVRSYCLMCMVTYGINFMLLFFSWLAVRRFGDTSFWGVLKADLAFAKQRLSTIAMTGAAFLFLSAGLVLFYPHYWDFKNIAPDAKVQFGVTSDGSPWIGAEHPKLTIVEFADYMCFQCGKMHIYLRQLVNQYPERIRLVHRHFPLDSRVNPIIREEVHPNAGMVSLFAVVAQDAGRFWRINDILFREARAKKGFNFSEIAKEGGLEISDFWEMINAPETIAHLERDLRAGLKLNITSTPSFLIDGKVYHGTIPKEILAEVIKAD